MSKYVNIPPASAGGGATDYDGWLGEEIAEKLTAYDPDVLALWVGPYATGEKYPSGQNNPAFDARIDETSLDIPAYFAANYANSLYVDLRSTMYAVDMPPLNLPAPGAASGIFTVDELHVNPRGRVHVYENYIRPVVSFG